MHLHTQILEWRFLPIHEQGEGHARGVSETPDAHRLQDTGVLELLSHQLRLEDVRHLLGIWLDAPATV